LLALFLGGFGAHLFYLNHRTRAYFYLGLWIAGIIFFIAEKSLGLSAIVGLACIVDFIILMAMEEKEFNSKYNSAV
jgi:membrane-bound ClpP family serine protease